MDYRMQLYDDKNLAWIDVMPAIGGALMTNHWAASEKVLAFPDVMFDDDSGTPVADVAETYATTGARVFRFEREAPSNPGEPYVRLICPESSS